jgi:hypothetical protein
VGCGGGAGAGAPPPPPPNLTLNPTPPPPQTPLVMSWPRGGPTEIETRSESKRGLAGPIKAPQINKAVAVLMAIGETITAYAGRKGLFKIKLLNCRCSACFFAGLAAGPKALPVCVTGREHIVHLTGLPVLQIPSQRAIYGTVPGGCQVGWAVYDLWVCLK